MKIAALEVFLIGPPFKAVFVLAGGIVGDPQQPTERVLVRLVTECGTVGWSEATPTPRWTYENELIARP